MHQTKHINDDTLITPSLVWECFPYQEEYVHAYLCLVALLVYAHEHTYRDDLQYLLGYKIIELENGKSAVDYGTFMKLATHQQNANRIVTLQKNLLCPPWPRSGMTLLKNLVAELANLRAWLTEKQAEREARAAMVTA